MRYAFFVLVILWAVMMFVLGYYAGAHDTHVKYQREIERINQERSKMIWTHQSTTP